MRQLVALFLLVFSMHFPISLTFRKVFLPEDFYLKAPTTNLYIADFNGDGKDDILRQQKEWSGLTVSHVLLATDEQSFRKIEFLLQYGLLGRIYQLYVGDFDGDGLYDFFVVYQWNKQANIFYSVGDGTFEVFLLPPEYDFDLDLVNTHIGDFNGDLKDDILRQEKGTWDDDRANTANIFLATGRGTFQKINLPEGFYIEGDLVNLHVGDFNGDGRADIFRQVKTENDVSNIFLSTPEKTLKLITLSEEFRLRGDMTNLYVGDFNGDGLDDIVRQEKNQWGLDGVNTAHIIFSTMQETFEPNLLQEYRLSDNLTNLYFGDFDGDGKQDILRQEKEFISPQYDGASILYSTIQGYFQKVVLPEDSELVGTKCALYVGDFNGDGKSDILRVSNDDAKDSYILFAE